MRQKWPNFETTLSMMYLTDGRRVGGRVADADEEEIWIFVWVLFCRENNF